HGFVLIDIWPAAVVGVFHRFLTMVQPMSINRLMLRGRTVRFVGIALFFSALTMPLAARAQTPGPVKLAIFEFELEDFSGAGGVVAETADDTAELKRATGEARQLIAQSGRY